MNHLALERRRHKFFQRILQEIQDQIKTIDLYLSQSFGIKTMGGNPYFLKNAGGFLGYIAQSTQTGGSHL
jgi:hypothetical protein